MTGTGRAIVSWVNPVGRHRAAMPPPGVTRVSAFAVLKPTYVREDGGQKTDDRKAASREIDWSFAFFASLAPLR